MIRRVASIKKLFERSSKFSDEQTTFLDANSRPELGCSHLLRSSRSNGRYSCDICGQNVPVGTVLYGCSPCNVDVCQNCKEEHFDAVTSSTSTARPFSLRGVSLRYLRELPLEEGDDFNDATEYIQDLTAESRGDRSLAAHLLRSKETRDFVKPVADVFVSYAWSGDFVSTMNALAARFADEPDVFVWMDFAVLDQHAANALASTTDLCPDGHNLTQNLWPDPSFPCDICDQNLAPDETSYECETCNYDVCNRCFREREKQSEHDDKFELWAQTFRESLKTIGKAVIVLSPGWAPIAIGRSWCCFEWVCIRESNIDFTCCVDPSDEARLTNSMVAGEISHVWFKSCFSKVDVERSSSFKLSDQAAILSLMKRQGVLEVNDIVRVSLKDWFVKVISGAQIIVQTEEGKLNLLVAKSDFHMVFEEYTLALPLIQEAIELASKSGDRHIVLETLQITHATALLKLKQFMNAERVIREAISQREAKYGAESKMLVEANILLGSILLEQGRITESQALLLRTYLGFHRTGIDTTHDVVCLLQSMYALHATSRVMSCHVQGERELLSGAVGIKVFGESHPDHALLLERYATVLYFEKDYLEAKDLCDRAHLTNMKTTGRCDMEFLTIYITLLRAMREGENAERVMRQLKETFESQVQFDMKRNGGKPSQFVLDNYKKFGESLFHLEEYTEATIVCREGLRMSIELYGVHGVETSLHKKLLGKVLIKQEAYVEEGKNILLEAVSTLNAGQREDLTLYGAEILNDLISISTDSPGEVEKYHESTIAMLKPFASLQGKLSLQMKDFVTYLDEQQHDYEKAVEVETDHVALLRDMRASATSTSLGVDEHNIAATVENLAELQSLCGRFDECKRSFAEAVEIYRRVHAGDTKTLSKCLSRIADNLRNVGLLEDAEVLSRESVAFVREIPEAVLTLALVLDTLANILLDKGENTEAVAIAEEIVRIREDRVASYDRILGFDMPTSELAEMFEALKGTMSADQSLAKSNLVDGMCLLARCLTVEGAENLEAETVVRKALLSLTEFKYSEEKVNTLRADCLSILSLVLLKSNRNLDEAEDVCREALEIRKEYEESSVPVSLCRLGLILKAKGADPAFWTKIRDEGLSKLGERYGWYNSLLRSMQTAFSEV